MVPDVMKVSDISSALRQEGVGSNLKTSVVSEGISCQQSASRLFTVVQNFEYPELCSSWERKSRKAKELKLPSYISGWRMNGSISARMF